MCLYLLQWRLVDMALQVVEFGLEVELEQVVVTSRVRDVMSFLGLYGLVNRRAPS